MKIRDLIEPLSAQGQLARYSGAIGATLLALIISMLVWNPPIDLVLFPIAILLSGIIWGPGPAFISATLSALLTMYFILPPVHVMAIGKRDDIQSYAAFLLASQLAFWVTRRLHAMRAKLEQTVRTREDTLAIVSHDLKNPLTQIRATCELLVLKPQLAEDPALVRRHAEQAVRASEFMGRLIEDLLTVASIQDGLLTIHKIFGDLRPVIQDAVTDAQIASQQKNIRLEQVLPGEAVWADFDAARMRQVMNNLLGNAIKFTPPGGSIMVSTAVRSEKVFISIRDSGPGFAPEDVPLVFERYWHGKDKASGSGLGLFISRGIIDAHYGKISAKSNGHGAEVNIILPAVQPRPAPALAKERWSY